VAGPAARAVALAIDGAIPLALYLAMTPLLVLSDIGIGLILIGPFLLEWLYPVIFEVLLGATPGKRSMGLVVFQDDGTPRGLPASLIRNLLRAVDFLPLFYGVGLVSMLADRDFRRLGDLAAGTLVVYGGKRPDGRGESYGVHELIPSVRPRPLPRGLPLRTQQAILAFAERSHRLSPERRGELAQTLVRGLYGPDSCDGQTAVELVLGYACWLAGGR
ncbi:MAG: RDD family protein, partial [Anaerolineae bacterium]